jgi:signal transduction histidine kinase
VHHSLDLGWFIRVRWLFVAGLAGAIVIGRYGLRIDFPLIETLTVGAVVFLYNVAFHAYHRRCAATPDPATSRVEAGLQIGLDLLALTTLTHLVGGAENPFIGFYLFHVIVGSTLLPRRDAWIVGAMAFGLFAGEVLLEFCGVVRHHHVAGLAETCRSRHGPFLLVTGLAFLVTLFSAISITTSIVSSLRERQRRLFAAQRDLERAYSTLREKQRQLVHHEKQASLGQLVAGMAHEINNPIQFIHGNMAVLSEAVADALPLLDEHHSARPSLRIARLHYPLFRQQIPVLLEDMAEGAERIAALVRDLKTFARRDEGRLDDTVDLNEAVRSSLRLLHPQVKHLRVEEELEPKLPKIRGSVTQLQQVVVNTVQNAAQALDAVDHGRIRVRTRAEHEARRVRLSIEDNGCGIPPALKDRIFDPFFTTRQRTGGTGLGLSITYGIIEQHRGAIEVESQTGAGTTFHFLLPLERDGAP